MAHTKGFASTMAPDSSGHFGQVRADRDGDRGGGGGCVRSRRLLT